MIKKLSFVIFILAFSCSLRFILAQNIEGEDKLSEETKPGEFWFQDVIMDDIKSPSSEYWYRFELNYQGIKEYAGSLNINTYPPTPDHYDSKYSVVYTIDSNFLRTTIRKISIYDKDNRILYSNINSTFTNLKDKTERTELFELRFFYDKFKYTIESPAGVATGEIPKGVILTEPLRIGLMLKNSGFKEGTYNFYTVESSLENPIQNVNVIVKSAEKKYILDEKGQQKEIIVYPCAYSFLLAPDFSNTVYYDSDGNLFSAEYRSTKVPNLSFKLERVKNKEEALGQKIKLFSAEGRRDPFHIPLVKRTPLSKEGKSTIDVSKQLLKLEQLHKDFEKKSKSGRNAAGDILSIKNEIMILQSDISKSKNTDAIKKVTTVLDKINNWLKKNNVFDVEVQISELQKYFDEIKKLKDRGLYEDALNLCSAVEKNVISLISEKDKKENQKIQELITKFSDMKARLLSIIDFLKKAPVITCILYEENEIRTPLNFRLQIFGNSVQPKVYYISRDTSTSLVILKKQTADKKSIEEEIYSIGSAIDADTKIVAINRDYIVVDYKGERINLYIKYTKSQKTTIK